MSLDVRTAETVLENLLRDAILYALGSRYAQQASIAALRAFATAGASGTMRSDDDLITTSIAGVITGWRWNTTSMAADNGTTVVQPDDVPSGKAGRWLAFTSTLRFSPTVGGDSMTLDQIANGSIARVVVLDKSMSPEEETALITAAVPAIIIEAHGDDPEDVVMNVGARWVTEFKFTITALTENLRYARQAAQGSAIDGTLGANDIDGFVQALLSGTVLNAAFAPDAPILNVRAGHAENRYSEFGQRRVWRIRDYAVKVSVENPAAPNDTSTVTDIYTQASLVRFAALESPPVINPPAPNPTPVYDPNNYLVDGCLVAVGGGLTSNVSAGSAVIAGAPVSYAGQSFTFAMFTDTYRDLGTDGTMTFSAVTAGGEIPPVTSNALRLGVTTTNRSTVVGDALLAQTLAPFGPDNDFPV